MSDLMTLNTTPDVTSDAILQASKSVRVVIAPRSADDLEKVVRVLKHCRYEVTYRRIEAPEEISNLSPSEWDIMIVDYAVAGFDSLRALKAICTNRPHLPMIVLCDSVGEELAAAIIKTGAQELLLRNNVGRLGPLVERAIREHARVAARELAHARLRRQSEYLATLEFIDEVINSSFDLKFTLEVILHRIVSNLQADAADILLFSESSGKLHHAASCGFRSADMGHISLSIGEGLAGRAALDRTTVIIPDLSEVSSALGPKLPLFTGEGFRFYCGTPMIAKSSVRGVLEVYRRSPFEPDEEWLSFFSSVVGQATIAFENGSLFQRLQRVNKELNQAYDATLQGWSRALDLRDAVTEGHTQRVTRLTTVLARKFQFSNEQLLHARRGAILHDIGKMAVPDAILRKQGALTEEEWTIMRKHPVYARDLLQPISYLNPAIDIPYCHHEKWDGSGYPRRLTRTAIPLAARIFAVADVWDALCSNRPYRAKWSDDRISEYMVQQRARQFDPDVVDVFLSVEEKVLDNLRAGEVVTQT